MRIVLRNDFALYAYFVTTLMKLKDGAGYSHFSTAIKPLTESSLNIYIEIRNRHNWRNENKEI